LGDGAGSKGAFVDTLKFIVDRWKIDVNKPSPHFIKISRFLSFRTLLKDLGFKKGAEIGVCTGRYSMKLCEGIPGLKLHCVDPWVPYDNYVEQHSESDAKNMNNAMRIARERLAKYGCNFIRKYSLDAANDIKDESLDFVFIDGNHSFEYVIDDIVAWSRKVRPGGIVAGHDYWNSVELQRGIWTENLNEKEKIRLCQVKDAVDAWTKSNRIHPWFVITGDQCPSFFWVKE
jgi:hypothetical protein